MIQWEYKVEQCQWLHQSELTIIGEEGWELTSVIFHYTSEATGRDYYNYIFKRPLKQQP